MILVKPDIAYREQFLDMMEEWRAEGEAIIPSAISDVTAENFEDMVLKFQRDEIEEFVLPPYVPATLLWAYEEERDRILGAVHIRHRLNEALRMDGGHIGDGIRPSERKKGYATRMIAMALLECRKMGITRVLMTCRKNNIGSAKSIQNNGGVYEGESMVEGELEQRYWIDNSR